MNSQDIVRAVVAAEGYLPLAIEKLKKSFPDEKISEYDIREAISADASATKSMSEQLRSLLILRMFDDLKTVQEKMMFSIDEMKPGDVARMWAAMMGVFANMTAPAVKDTFDFEAEAIKASELLGLPLDVVREDLKRLRANKSEAAKSS